MKKLINGLVVLGAAMAVLVSCQNPTSFTGTEHSAATKTTVATTANGNRTNNGSLSVSLSGTPAAGATTNNKEVIQIVFNGGSVDEASLTAVSFHNLKATAATDGARDRDNALTPASKVVTYDANANQTTVRYYFDFTTAANVSNIIEVFIVPATLTANGGTKKLNLDTDFIQGETQDDDYVGYVNVTGGTKAAGGVNGNAKTPRAGWQFNPGTFAISGGTTHTWNYPSVAADDTNYKSLLDSALKLQRFDGTTWGDISTTTTYSTSSGNYVVTFSAVAGKEVYRYKVNFTGLIASKAINGYKQKAEYDQAKTVGYFDVGTLASLAVAEPIATTTYNLGTNFDATSSFNGSGYDGVVTLTFNDVGSEGLSGVSATTVKLYDATNKKYVPVSSVVTYSAGAGSTVYKFILDTAYKSTGGTLQVQISPDVVDLGATTASTDNLKYGNWKNTGKDDAANGFGLPYGWKIKNTTGTI